MVTAWGAEDTAMRFVTASISLGLFTWLSYMVFTGKFADGAGSGSKARVLNVAIDQLVGLMGVNHAALALLGFGALLSFTIIVFGPRDDEA